MQKHNYGRSSLNKEFERCCTFLAEMMEKYGLLVMQDILEELHYDPETWGYDASHIEYNNRFIVSFGKFFAEVYFFATSC